MTSEEFLDKKKILNHKLDDIWLHELLDEFSLANQSTQNESDFVKSIIKHIVPILHEIALLKLKYNHANKKGDTNFMEMYEKLCEGCLNNIKQTIKVQGISLENEPLYQFMLDPTKVNTISEK